MQDSDTTPEATARAPESGLRGFTVIENQSKTLPGTPGVYRMVNAKGEVLYVGKARNLKKRVASYASPAKLSNRIQRMVAETASLEVISTHTEVEALLLESNLIKKLRPRFNVTLRDDKSFPYILITADHAWPRVTKYRGARSAKGEYYGPFASAGAVNRTLNWLERAFLLRSCADTVFATRARPCLLHQIKRCSAPCVGRIAPEDYAALVAQASQFLGGRSQEVQRDLAARMQAASDTLDFETAAAFRDRIRALTQVQAHQGMNLSGLTDADVIAAHAEGDQVSVQVFFFRAGNNNGNRAYFPRHDRSMSVEEVLGAFIGQFYDNKIPPPLLLLSHAVPDQALLAEALSVAADRKVELSVPARGDRRKMMEHALLNARDAMARHLSESATQRKLLEGVAEAFGLESPPQRIEVYDNSHIMGTNAYGAMIVAGPEGLMKNAYRKFAIRSTQVKPGDGIDSAETAPGDDYGMMREVLTRRFTRALKEDPERDQGLWPDLVVIDGGLGQLGVARKVLADLGIDDVALAGIAKGPDRNAGRETFHLPDREPFTLEPRDPVLFFMQRLRDEAHRFAIGAHRAKRSKALGRSALDEIPGIGARRKRALLHHFGSARGVERAGLEDLEAVPGVSSAMAKKIYDHFHGQG